MLNCCAVKELRALVFIFLIVKWLTSSLYYIFHLMIAGVFVAFFVVVVALDLF